MHLKMWRDVISDQFRFGNARVELGLPYEGEETMGLVGKMIKKGRKGYEAR